MPEREKKKILQFFKAEYICTLLCFLSTSTNRTTPDRPWTHALTFLNGCQEQRLPLLEVGGIASKQQPFMGGLLLQRALVQGSKHLLFVCQTLLYMLVPQSESI